MKSGSSTISFCLAAVAALLAAIASAVGLFFPSVYHDNEFVRTAWYGNDLVTLIVIVPSLLVTLLLFKRSAVKPQLIRMGLLGYLVYTYAFYLFGAAFNVLFLVYAALFSVSLFALITGLTAISIHSISSISVSTRWISSYLLLIALMLCVVEVPPCITFITKGTIPDLVVKTAHPTNMVYALDLTLIVPVMVLAAILLWRNRSWGYVLGAMMLLKGFAYGLVLVIGTLLLAQKNISDPLLPVWIFISMGGLTGLIILLKKIDCKT